MIYANLQGNLGNQMFIYALARDIQKKTGSQINLSKILIKRNAEYKYSLDKFKLNENVTVSESGNKINYIITTILYSIYRMSARIGKENSNIFITIFGFLSYFNIYFWMGETYVEIKLNHRFKNIYLIGYWQSEKYFFNLNEELHNEFYPKIEKIKENKNLYKIISTRESICVSVRRGDYVTNEAYKKVFNVTNEAYFRTAVSILSKKLIKPTIICFSDDIKWVKENIDFNNYEVYYEHGTDPVWEKLRMMSECKHFVIANSSFSWWAQYLSKSKNKIVVAPDRWYVDGRKTDIYQKNWLLCKGMS